MGMRHGVFRRPEIKNIGRDSIPGRPGTMTCKSDRGVLPQCVYSISVYWREMYAMTGLNKPQEEVGEENTPTWIWTRSIRVHEVWEPCCGKEAPFAPPQRRPQSPLGFVKFGSTTTFLFFSLSGDCSYSLYLDRAYIEPSVLMRIFGCWFSVDMGAHTDLGSGNLNWQMAAQAGHQQR